MRGVAAGRVVGGLGAVDDEPGAASPPSSSPEHAASTSALAPPSSSWRRVIGMPGNVAGARCVSRSMMAGAMKAEGAREDGFVDLYRARWEPMVRLAYLMTGSQAIAEELVQDAFVSLHRNWHRATSPDVYLRASVVNACRSWGRRRSLERLRTPRPPEPGGLVADEMWDVLLTLPPRQRAAIVLRFYEDRPDEEIAVLLGCKVATVRTAVFRGLEKLRKEIER